MSFGLQQEGGSLIAPMALAQPLHPIDSRSRNRRRNLWFGWCVSSWWPLFLSSSMLIYIYYLYVYILYEFCYMTYIYTNNRSVVQYWWSCTPSQSIGLLFFIGGGGGGGGGGARFLGWMPLFCFLWFTNCVLLYDKYSSTRMLVTFGTCFIQHVDTRYLAFCNLSPPRMFLPLDLSEYRILHGAIGPLYVTSSYSTWIFCRGAYVLDIRNSTVPSKRATRGGHPQVFFMQCQCGGWSSG